MALNIDVWVVAARLDQAKVLDEGASPRNLGALLRAAARESLSIAVIRQKALASCGSWGKQMP